MHPLEIRVPATTANLGAGYDLIGAALGFGNRFIFTPASALEIQLSGPLATQAHLPQDQRNTVIQVIEQAYRERGLPGPTFKLDIELHVPPARGLGSSSTAIAAGLLAAQHWLNQPWSPPELLARAIAWEGHPDNIAPALLGGCRLNLTTSDHHWHCARLPVPADLHWIVCSPDFELETHAARAVVPESLTRADCIRNSGYLASLIAGLLQNDDTLIRLGLHDLLHQPARARLIPGMSAVIDAACEAGALGAVLSGAGPSLLALSRTHPEKIATAMQSAWEQIGISSRVVITSVAHEGAQVLY
jgi:homoserine kinase